MRRGELLEIVGGWGGRGEGELLAIAREWGSGSRRMKKVKTGIISFGSYVPYRRLDRGDIAKTMGSGGGKGERSVASYDEDTTTMGAEAARAAKRDAAGTAVDAVWFSTTSPAYLEKTNAGAIHAVLRLPQESSAADFGGAARSGIAALGAALRAAAGGSSTMVVASDIRTGLATGSDESNGGDGAAAILVGAESSAGATRAAGDLAESSESAEGSGSQAGSGSSGGPESSTRAETEAAPLLAACIAQASATEEFTDRWRTPGDVGAKQWEERFAESVYVPLFEKAWAQAMEQVGQVGVEQAGQAGAGQTEMGQAEAGQAEQAGAGQAGQAGAEQAVPKIDVAVVAGTHARSVRRVASGLASGRGLALGCEVGRVAADLSDSVGNTGTAHSLLLLAHELEQAQPNQTIAVVSLIDGVDILVFRTTDAIDSHAVSRPLSAQIAAKGKVSYGKFLNWRGQLQVQPPNRLEPERPSMSAAARSGEWKFGFVGSQGQESGTVHLPPARVSIRDEDAADAMDPIAMADVPAKVVTYTVDRLVYSVSPPVVFAIVDFEGGGRLPVELTDVEPDEVEVGMSVEMTFRKLYSSDGIQNYFWKARPVRGEAQKWHRKEIML